MIVDCAVQGGKFVIPLPGADVPKVWEASVLQAIGESYSMSDRCVCVCVCVCVRVCVSRSHVLCAVCVGWCLRAVVVRLNPPHIDC